MERFAGFTSLDIDALLYGSDDTTGIVAVEFLGDNRFMVCIRDETGSTRRVEERFAPWLVCASTDWLASIPGSPQVSRLSGSLPLGWLVRADSWAHFLSLRNHARECGEAYYAPSSPVEHYLVGTGRSLFKGMHVNDVRRLQLDLETLGLDPGRPEAQIIMVALRTNHGHEEVLTLETTERDLLERATARVLQLDPDTIEGHNLFGFDLPYLQTRANLAGMALRWGRDGRPLQVLDRTARVRVGGRSMPYRPCVISGRHVIDTYHQIQRYDRAANLTGYGLKAVIRQLGLERPGRTFVEGDQIGQMWLSDPKQLAAYALDDVRDTSDLADLMLPTEFYLTQMVPQSLQDSATGGTGEKIDLLLARAYIHAGHSLPIPNQPQDYPGGYSDVLQTGRFAPVVKGDIESLYPSIMLMDGIVAGSDTLGASLPMLRELTTRRLEAKKMSRATDGSERVRWSGLQESYKVLINSFYGYLGYGRGLFNDFDAAAQVTLRGQALIKQAMAKLVELGATPVEVDTDGIFVAPPTGKTSEDDLHKLIAEASAPLPAEIRFSFDGSYAAMLSLKIKTYALLTHEGTVLLKGSALRNRRTERCFRSFIADAARAFLLDERDAARNDYFELARAIQDRILAPSQISQWILPNDETLSRQPRLKRLMDRHRLQATTDRLDVYERADGELALTTEYAGDENQTYLLKRLWESAQRYEPLFTSDSAFNAFFPKIGVSTNLEDAKKTEQVSQPGLF